jgi:hypothetical protein
MQQLRQHQRLLVGVWCELNREKRVFEITVRVTACRDPFMFRPQMNLDDTISEIADGLVKIDSKGVPFRAFQPGVGPYGEPQVVKLLAEYLNQLPKYREAVRTKRTPDLLIPGAWAMEFKIARPFGDNGRAAENWSVNLLHPYEGNVSTIGDCYKLAKLECAEKKAVVVIGYEHLPPKVSLTPLIESFEAVARYVAGIELSERVECRRDGLAHPVHQSVRVFAWQVMGVVQH